MSDLSVGTHWVDCWKDRAHHGCALARIRELEAALREWRDVQCDQVMNLRFMKRVDALLDPATSETESKHSTEEDYRHFLSYSGLPNTAELQLAYYAGAGKTMEDAPAPPAKLTQKQIADSIQRKFEDALKPIASADDGESEYGD